MKPERAPAAPRNAVRPANSLGFYMLGASQREGMKRVIGEGILLVAGGVLVGLPAAWLVAQFATAQGFLAKEVAYSEPIALAAGVLLAAYALAMLALSARTAAVDPTRALREG